MAFWFCFVVFTLILYTAAMVSIVSSVKPEMKVMPYSDLDDLVQSGEYKFASIYGGSTWQFFKNSANFQYEKIYADLGRVSNVEDGVEKARSGQYVFIGESPMLQKHLNSEPCDLVKVGYALDSKAYGIGLPKGSSYTNMISDELLKMQEDGTLQMLYNKWWRMESSCPDLPEAEEGYDAQSGGTKIDEYRFAGAIVILIIGVALSTVIAILEYFLYKRRTTVSYTALLIK